jgi:hypothetical protein
MDSPETVAKRGDFRLIAKHMFGLATNGARKAERGLKWRFEE